MRVEINLEITGNMMNDPMEWDEIIDSCVPIHSPLVSRSG